MPCPIDLSIILPCFNEAQNIKIVLPQLQRLIEKASLHIEVIVIDGASTDQTPFELETIFKTLPSDNFTLILQKERGGYGGDIMSALKVAKGNILSWSHADLQTDPSDILVAYEKYQILSQNNQKVFIKGQRKNRHPLEAFFTFGMQIVTYFCLKQYISDINAQPKLFSRAFYETYLKEGYPTDFSLDLFALYQAKINQYTIDTIPVYFKKRLHGEAKGGGGGWKMRFNLIKRTFKYILKLRRQFKSQNI